MKKHASVIIANGKAYLPARALTQPGFLQDVEPVHVTGLSRRELLSSLLDVLKAGNPRIETPTLLELDFRSHRNDPVPRATSARNSKELGRIAVWC